jgi:hypothetical protein
MGIDAQYLQWSSQLVLGPWAKSTCTHHAPHGTGPFYSHDAVRAISSAAGSLLVNGIIIILYSSSSGTQQWVYSISTDSSILSEAAATLFYK